MSFVLLIFAALVGSVSVSAFSNTVSNTFVGRNGETTLKMAVTLDDLPYDYTALEPHIGEQTLRIHHGKHHAKYVATTNDMIKGTDMEGDDAVTIARKAYGNNQVSIDKCLFFFLS